MRKLWRFRAVRERLEQPRVEHSTAVQEYAKPRVLTQSEGRQAGTFLASAKVLP